ncbi:MAG TPA: phosphoribosylanthranilate isomerase [Steroidobacteraceae bacterium]
MWIKICGITTPAAVDAALASGVDAIGFVFAESVRRVTPEFACELAAPARGRVRCVAVTRHATQIDVDAMIAIFAPDVLQADASDFERIRLPRHLSVLPVVRAGVAAPVPLPARILFEGPASGAGMPCDWSAAGKLAHGCELVLAGGLTAGNVAAAIEVVQPFGVDVSSGVEERPGVKSPQEIARFVEACRRKGKS